jgi:peptidyl-tRNA hydrolase
VGVDGHWKRVSFSLASSADRVIFSVDDPPPNVLDAVWIHGSLQLGSYLLSKTMFPSVAASPKANLVFVIDECIQVEASHLFQNTAAFHLLRPCGSGALNEMLMANSGMRGQRGVPYLTIESKCIRFCPCLLLIDIGPQVCGCKAEDALCHYVIIRADLPLGFMAAQIVHAAGETSPGNIPPETNAIVLSVPDEASLLSVHDRLTKAGLGHHLVSEPDAPWNGQATAIGIPPAPRTCIRPYLSSLPLLRGKEAAI